MEPGTNAHDEGGGFPRVNRIQLEEVPKPVPRAGEAVIRVTATTICGTDVHIVRGEYPVAPGRILGHEPVGVIDGVMNVALHPVVITPTVCCSRRLVPQSTTSARRAG